MEINVLEENIEELKIRTKNNEISGKNYSIETLMAKIILELNDKLKEKKCKKRYRI